VVTDAEILECDYRRMPHAARKIVGLSGDRYATSPFALLTEPVDTTPPLVRRVAPRRLFAEI
jgi:hypothetical protein